MTPSPAAVRRQPGDRHRQSKVEALVRLDVGPVAEEVELIAVIELDARVRHSLDTVEGGRAPLLHRTRVVRQLGRE